MGIPQVAKATFLTAPFFCLPGTKTKKKETIKMGKPKKADVTNTDLSGEKGFEFRQGSMDAIVAKRNAEFEEETGLDLAEEEGTDDDDDDDTDSDTEDDSEDAAADDSEPEEDTDTDKPEDDKDEDQIELIIDGEKKTMPRSKVISIAQKNLAADQRLQEAEIKRKEADELLKSAAKPQDTEPDTDRIDDDTTVDADKLIADKRSAYLHAINYGEPDEQEQAMIEYEEAIRGSTGPGQASFDADEMTKTIKAEIKEELTGDQIRDRFALPKSQGGFADIMEDDDLKEFAFTRIDKAIEAGADPYKWKTYADAAKAVRKRFISKDSNRQPADKDTLRDKKERKRKIDNLETVSDTKESSIAKKSPPSSKGDRQETIAEMARTRPGQHIY